MKIRFIANNLIIIISTLLFAYIAWNYSVQQTPEYRSTLGFLVVQEQKEEFDPTSAIRSAERIASNLASVMPTENFFNELLLTDESLLQAFPRDPETQRKIWKKTVEASSEGGFIHISLYHQNRATTALLASSTAAVLTQNSHLWHGAGDRVRVKTIDTPLTSQQPVRPNILANTIMGGVVGIVLSGAAVLYIYYFQQRKKTMQQYYQKLQQYTNGYSNGTNGMRYHPALAQQTRRNGHNGNGGSDQLRYIPQSDSSSGNDNGST